MLIAPEKKLNIKQWSDWKKNLLVTGNYDPNLWDNLGKYQKQWTADTLVTLKALSKEQ